MWEDDLQTLRLSWALRGGSCRWEKARLLPGKIIARQDYCQARSSEQEEVEGLTLEQEAELLEQKRGKDFASMTERLGRLEELARCGVRSLKSLTDLPLNRVGAARTCHHLLKAGLRFSNS